MRRLFDAYVMVDWSAAAKPTTGANSIWIGILARNARLKMQFASANPDTRLKARQFIIDMIGKLTSRGDRVLVGFDFSFGYPDGTAEALGITKPGEPGWQTMRRYLAGKVKEKPDNSNARFAIAASMNYAMTKGPYPFWGAPKRDQVSTLSGTKGDFATGPVSEFRLAEMHLRDSGRGQPKSCWQLAYTGSVGSQTLMGLPHVHAIRDEIPTARIWPFETGLRRLDEEVLDGVNVVLAEIYPSLISPQPEKGETVDLAQVRQIAHHYWGLDEKGQLGAAFGPPKGLDVARIPQIEAEEGWILGI